MLFSKVYKKVKFKGFLYLEPFFNTGHFPTLRLGSRFWSPLRPRLLQDHLQIILLIIQSRLECCYLKPMAPPFLFWHCRLLRLNCSTSASSQNQGSCPRNQNWPRNNGLTFLSRSCPQQISQNVPSTFKNYANHFNRFKHHFEEFKKV